MTYASLALVTAPDAAPVSLSEARAHLRIEGTDEDAYIQLLIDAATAKLEAEYGLAFTSQVWRITLDEFPYDGIVKLPRHPVTAIGSVAYLDSAGASQTWAASNYILTAGARPPRVTLAYGVSLPTTYGVADAVTIQFTAGYADNAVPGNLKSAVLLYVGHLYENREPVIAGSSLAPIPDLIDGLLCDERQWWF